VEGIDGMVDVFFAVIVDAKVVDCEGELDSMHDVFP
jgi:hypothetical protein